MVLAIGHSGHHAMHPTRTHATPSTHCVTRCAYTHTVSEHTAGRQARVAAGPTRTHRTSTALVQIALTHCDGNCAYCAMRSARLHARPRTLRTLPCARIHYTHARTIATRTAAPPTLRHAPHPPFTNMYCTAHRPLRHMCYAPCALPHPRTRAPPTRPSACAHYLDTVHALTRTHVCEAGYHRHPQELAVHGDHPYAKAAACDAGHNVLCAIDDLNACREDGRRILRVGHDGVAVVGQPLLPHLWRVSELQEVIHAPLLLLWQRQHHCHSYVPRHRVRRRCTVQRTRLAASGRRQSTRNALGFHGRRHVVFVDAADLRRAAGKTRVMVRSRVAFRVVIVAEVLSGRNGAMSTCRRASRARYDQCCDEQHRHISHICRLRPDSPVGERGQGGGERKEQRSGGRGSRT